MDIKSIIAILICVTALGIFVKSCQAPQTTTTKIAQNSKSEQVSTQVQLSRIEGINYSIKNIQPSTAGYIKERSEYKDLYSENKKFVIYFVGADCPYAQAFIENIEPLKSVPEISANYNFYPVEAQGMKTFNNQADAQADIDFSNTCQEFCIVNPAKKQIFSIDGIGNEEAKKIRTIMEQLKDW